MKILYFWMFSVYKAIRNRFFFIIYLVKVDVFALMHILDNPVRKELNGKKHQA